MGVSVHTLRYWTNEGLIEPEVVDPDSGYRYYSFNQLHYIHRVKYLRDMDVPIAAIREAIREDNADPAADHAKTSYRLNSLATARRCMRWLWLSAESWELT